MRSTNCKIQIRPFFCRRPFKIRGKFCLVKEAKKDSEEGKNLREIMNQGKIVPSTITCGLLKKNMDISEGGTVKKKI